MTCKQNASMTMGKSRPHALDNFDDGNLVCKAVDCLLSLLLSLIRCAFS